MRRTEPLDTDVHYLLQRVRENPTHCWTVTELAAECGMSARELQRRCRTSSGHGPKQLILQERHRAAAIMLSEGHATITDLAEQFGFSEAAAFSRSFTKTCGYPPSQCLTGC